MSRASFRFFPASVMITGDTGIPERVAIDEINKMLHDALVRDGSSPTRYRLQLLSVEQFVTAEPKKAKKPAAKTRRTR